MRTEVIHAVQDERRKLVRKLRVESEHHHVLNTQQELLDAAAALLEAVKALNSFLEEEEDFSINNNNVSLIEAQMQFNKARQILGIR